MNHDEWSATSWLAAGARPDGPGEPLNTPIVPASNFVHGGDFEYARDEGTPTWVALETLMARLEGGKALAFGSGMAAIASVFDQLAVGAHIVWPDDCYQGVAGIIAAGEAHGRWTAERLPVDATDSWVERSSDADLVWLESPSNPLLSIADLPAICAAPRKPGAILAVDNTVATPLNQRPLELGADVSITSATKYVGGHSDLLCGITVCREAALHEQLFRSRLLNGATPGNLEAFLATRGARTMALRLRAAEKSAQTLAERLEQHDGIDQVRYPGLKSHPQHELAKQLLGGFGTIVTFDIAGGAEPAEQMLKRLRLLTKATSFGAVETTIERRASIPGQEHLPPGLLRMSVGIEDVDDLWTDLERALA
ncbi:MAG: PLP-dependent transferase [Acidimicrobiales bacterium]|nr:PLP-dependent transferase [Acidimicrobiales bacterium]